MKQDVALITGASQGIGKNIAIKLARNNIHVIIVARNIEKLREAQLEIEKNDGICYLFKCDVTKYQQIKVLVNYSWLKPTSFQY